MNALPATSQVRLPYRRPSVTSGNAAAQPATSSSVTTARGYGSAPTVAGTGRRVVAPVTGG